MSICFAFSPLSSGALCKGPVHPLARKLAVTTGPSSVSDAMPGRDPVFGHEAQDGIRWCGNHGASDAILISLEFRT
jgi:hypothetical protein